MTDYLIGIPLVIALLFVYAWGVILGWDWGARRGWSWPVQLVAAIVTAVWAPLLLVLRVLARWIGWQPKPRTPSFPPMEVFGGHPLIASRSAQPGSAYIVNDTTTGRPTIVAHPNDVDRFRELWDQKPSEFLASRSEPYSPPQLKDGPPPEWIFWDDPPPQRNMTHEELERMRQWCSNKYLVKRYEEHLAKQIDEERRRAFPPPLP